MFLFSKSRAPDRATFTTGSLAQDATNLKKKKKNGIQHKNILFQYEFRFSVYKKMQNADWTKHD